MSEQKYRFPGMDIHAAIIVQRAIELRKDTMTSEAEKALQTSDKAIKAIVLELDQMWDDLDRHIASIVKRQEHEKEAPHAG